MPRAICDVAREIRRDWKKVNYAAAPYLDAMGSLSGGDSTYGQDSAKSIVLYFLSNAGSYRGATAKRVKEELKEAVGLPFKAVAPVAPVEAPKAPTPQVPALRGMTPLGLPEAAPVSFATEVTADGSGKWVGNGLRFSTREAASTYVRGLAMRWTLVRETRVVESNDPVTEKT